MIADRNTGVERVSTLQGEKIAMSIDTSSAAMKHIMDSMIDLYADQELACIREYSTNAWDAHVMAGRTDRPIEVDLPGPLSPFLTVRDFGIGLSVDDIFDVYSKYGASTKRDSNDVQGMLGYGCKAALSYTPQFTVTSVKDGVRAQIAVSRESTGGSMQIVDTSTTTESNGTTITIPVRRENGFGGKARTFFSFWEAGTVLVNGKPPEQVEGLPIGKNMMVFDSGKRYEEAQSYVVMGKVAYPARFPNLNLNRGYSLVARVEIGDVNFTPSREGLMEQDRTTTLTLQRIVDEFDKLAPAAIQEQIDKATTAPEALRTMVEFQAMLPRTQGQAYAFKGKPLPSTWRFGHGTTLAERRSSALGSCTQVWDWPATQWPETLWIENHDGIKYTASHKRKTLQWCEANGKQDVKHFVHMPMPLPAEIRPYVAASNIVQWADIKAEKLPTTNSGSNYSGYATKAITGSFDVWVDGDWKGEVAAKDFDANKPMFYRHGNRAQNRAYEALLTALNPSNTFVCVPGNRLAKFKRDFPKAVEAGETALKARKGWATSLGDDTLVALAMYDAGMTTFFADLDGLKVNDPAIKRAIRISKIDLTKVEKQRKLFLQAVRSAEIQLPRFDNPIKAYPLIRAQYGRYHSVEHTDHFYLYVNAAYAASKNGA